jgi:large subunit ribosomal protein L10
MRDIIVKKQQAVEVLTEKLTTASSAIVFEYPGLTVFQFTELRTKLREAGCEAKVYKNNIARRAAAKAGFMEFSEIFTGPKAIAISYQDPVAPAKIISDFAKANKVVTLTASLVEGAFYDEEQTKALAALPSREVLLTQLAVGLLTPIRELAIGLNMISEQASE